MLTLTIIMPALNEADNVSSAISSALDALDEYGIEGELIVVNDGSTDETENKVLEFIEKDARIRLLTHDSPHGIGQSYWDGVQAANNELVILVPGDNEMDPSDVLRYIDLMEHVDIIVPFFINKEVRDKTRRILSALYRFIINISFGANLNYTNGSVIYRKCILDDGLLRSKGFFYQTELLVKLIRKGYLYGEVPNFLLKRDKGESKAVTFRSLMNIVHGYLSLFYDIHIKRIDTYLKNYRTLHQDSVSYKYRAENQAKIDTSYYSG